MPAPLTPSRPVSRPAAGLRHARELFLGGGGVGGGGVLHGGLIPPDTRRDTRRVSRREST
eukprot:5847751-Prymnesium_polylepis.1